MVKHIFEVLSDHPVSTPHAIPTFWATENTPFFVVNITTVTACMFDSGDHLNISVVPPAVCIRQSFVTKSSCSTV